MKINTLQVEIDGIDKEILRDLMADARKPILQIANKIGISGAAIHQRLRIKHYEIRRNSFRK